MKIATIGAGNWGINLVRNLHEIGVLAGVADAHEKLRLGVQAEFPRLHVCANYTDFLQSDIDAVVIATPATTHYEIAKAFLENGKDVFVEKPIALNSAHAEDLVSIADKNQRILMVGHLLLYQPAIQWIKEYIKAGKLGAIYSLHQERLKLGRARSVENVLWSLGVHDIAVLLYLAGKEPENLVFSGHAGLQSGIEDDTYVHLSFADGLKAHLHNSWLWPENRRRLTVIAEKGMLVYDEISQLVTLHRKTIDGALQNQDAGEEVAFSGNGQPLRLELEHFIHCVKNRCQPISNGQNGVDVVRVLEKAG